MGLSYRRIFLADVAETWAATLPREGGMLGRRSLLQPTQCWSGIEHPLGPVARPQQNLARGAAALTRLLQRATCIFARTSAVEFIPQVSWSLWRNSRASFYVSAVELRPQIFGRDSPHRGRALRCRCFVPAPG
jgi:hypothetical protein